MRYVLAVVSDLHCGSTLGLCGPEPVELDDGGLYTPSAIQRWLWERWADYWRRVEVARQGAYLGVFVNGDAVDGPEHHGTVQVVSRHPNVQFDILTRVAQPIIDINPNVVVVVRGTESHVGKSGSAEEGFARWLGARLPNLVPRHESRQTASWWRFTGDFGRFRVDAAHHGRMGNRPWTKAGQVANYAAQIFYEYATTNRRWPDLAFRSHYHKVVDSYDMHPVRVIQTPAWQVATAFVHRIAPDAIADIGGLIVTLDDDGPAMVEKVLYPPSEGTIWRAPTQPLTNSSRKSNGSVAGRTTRAVPRKSGPSS